jgi:hypothetical protein
MTESCPRCGSLRAEKMKPCACGYLMETAFTPVLDGQATGIVRHEASEPNLDRTIENLPLARHWLVQLCLQLGPSGIFLAIGGLAGFVVAFLPLKSATAAFFGQGGFGSTMVIEDWRGMVGLVGYGGALVLAVMLFPARGLPAKGWVSSVPGRDPRDPWQSR